MRSIKNRSDSICSNLGDETGSGVVQRAIHVSLAAVVLLLASCGARSGLDVQLEDTSEADVIAADVIDAPVDVPALSPGPIDPAVLAAARARFASYHELDTGYVFDHSFDFEIDCTMRSVDRYDVADGSLVERRARATEDECAAFVVLAVRDDVLTGLRTLSDYGGEGFFVRVALRDGTMLGGSLFAGLGPGPEGPKTLAHAAAYLRKKYFSTR